MSLKDISIVKTLGVGGFGRVELVSYSTKLTTKLNYNYVMPTVVYLLLLRTSCVSPLQKTHLHGFNCLWKRSNKVDEIH